jgi:hypothetical protein
LPDPSPQGLRSSGGFEGRDRVGSLADLARQDCKAFRIECRLRAPVGDLHREQFPIQFLAQPGNLFVRTSPDFCEQRIRRFRQVVADLVQLFLLGPHLLGGIEERERPCLGCSQFGQQPVVKLSALLRRRRLCGLAQHFVDFACDLLGLLRRPLVVVVGVAKGAAAHRFKKSFDVHDAAGAVRHRVQRRHIALDPVELRDGEQNQRQRDQHEKSESGIELGLDRHRHSLRSVRGTWQYAFCASRTVMTWLALQNWRGVAGQGET